MAELAKLDSRLVSTQLAQFLRKRSSSPLARLNAVWALTRVDAPAARAAVRSVLEEPEPIVEQAAAHSCGLYRDGDAAPALRRLLKSVGEPVKREAATALGQIRDKAAVGDLLDATQGPMDRAFEHAIIYALIQIDDPDATRAALKSSVPSTQRAALIALDQMDNGRLSADSVVPLLSSSESILKETAGWIAGHHPEWAAQLRAFFKSRLEEVTASTGAPKELQAQIIQFVRERPVQDLITETLSSSRVPDVRTLLLNAIAEANLKTAPSGWASQVATALHESDPIARAGLKAVHSVVSTNKTDSSLNQALLALAQTSARPDDLRLEALSQLPAGLGLDEPLFDFALAHLDSTRPPLQRINAATVLGRTALSEAQLMQLAGALPKAGPLELTRLLPAFDAHSTEEIGLKLVGGLKDSKAVSALPAETLRNRLNKFPDTVQTAGAELLRSLNASTADKKKRLDEIEASLPAGDHRRGQLIFNGTKAACATCHAVGYLGGQLGPDLTRIGSIRTQRDLLEAVLYPSASFARGFEPMMIVTKDGEQYSGLIRREASGSLVLVSGPTTEQRIARADITEMRPGTVSVMPEGLDQQLTRQELADLVAFLRALK